MHLPSWLKRKPKPQPAPDLRVLTLPITDAETPFTPIGGWDSADALDPLFDVPAKEADMIWVDMMVERQLASGSLSTLPDLLDRELVARFAGYHRMADAQAVQSRNMIDKFHANGQRHLVALGTRLGRLREKVVRLETERDAWLDELDPLPSASYERVVPSSLRSSRR